MNRLASSLALCALGLLLMGQAPGAAVKPHLTYVVGVGGLSAGTFTSMKVSSHTVMLAGADVKIVATKTQTDQAPIVFSGGTVASFVKKRLTSMVGQQMTVTVDVSAVGAALGQRCKFTLDHAQLKVLKHDELQFRPSELPDFECK